MKTLDLMRLAVKSLWTRGVALPLLGFAIGAFCLCVAGAVTTAVQAEKAKPFELTVSAQNNVGISDATIAKLAALPGVMAATSVFNVPATVKTGSYTAALTLTGIDGDYLGAYWLGGAFPEESVMPYLVLNKAACKQFSNGSSGNDGGDEPSEDSADGQDTTQSPPPSVDWLNTSFTVQAGSPRSVVSKVCGILAGDDTEQQPAAYVSLATAKGLLREAGRNSVVTAALVRVRNIGTANGVSGSIQALGLAVADTNAGRQAQWDVETEEASFLLAAGLLALLYAAAMLAAQRKSLLFEQRKVWSMLLWLGLRPHDIDRLFMFQAGILSLFGAVIGIAVAAVLPSFLPQDSTVKSIFLLSVPRVVAIADLAVCFIIGTLPMLHTKSNNILRNDVQKEVQYALDD